MHWEFGGLKLTEIRENWQSGEENRKRGMDWLMEIYRHNDASTADRMAAHKDFRKGSCSMIARAFTDLGSRMAFD